MKLFKAMVSKRVFYRETKFKETPIGNIPEAWTIRRFPEVVFFQEGPGIRTKQYRRMGIPFLNIVCIKQNGQIDLTQAKYLEEKEVNEKYKHFLLEEADLVVSSSGTLGRCAEVRKEHLPLMLNTSIIRMRSASRELDRRFLKYFIRSSFYQKQIINAATGSAQKNYGPSHLKRMIIVLPTILEQNAVVEILSIVDLAIEKTDEIIARANRLKESLMQQLLTRGIGHTEYKDAPIGKIPKTWKVTTIDEECSVGTGGTPARNIAKYFGGDIPWAKSTEVDYNVITKTGETLTGQGLQNSNAQVYPAGSLVIALYGQGRTRGKCAILGIDAAINQACAVIQSKGRIHIPYLFYWCQNSYSAIRGLSQGANQLNLNMGIIRSLQIPLPAISEQKKITEILSTIDVKLKIEKNEKSKMERIKQGLMDLLLTGKIRIKVD